MVMYPGLLLLLKIGMVIWCLLCFHVKFKILFFSVLLLNQDSFMEYLKTEIDGDHCIEIKLIYHVGAVL